MAVSHLLLFTVTHTQLRHTSFAILGCGWWLVVGGWWLVVGGWWSVSVVVAAVVVMSWGLASDICADPRSLRPPRIRMRVEWHLQSYVRRWHSKDHDFLTLRVRGLGPADPKGRKIFLRLRMPRFDLVQFGHFHEGRLQKMLRGGGCFGPFPSTPVGEITSSDPDLSDSDRTESGL